MGLLHRFRRRRAPAGAWTGGGRTSAVNPDDEQHLRAFVAQRRGIEGFVEPRTTVSDVTLLLVAHDGEWTRRRVPSVAWAHHFANSLGVPSYDAAVVGIPARMREYNRRQRAARNQSGLDGVGGA